MNEAALYCRSCGKALTEEEKGPGNVQCAACKVAAPPPPLDSGRPYSPYSAPAAPPVANAPSPGLAFLLGLIPGVGAIYNGQYAKGLVHVFVMGMLATIADSSRGAGEALFTMLIIAWVAYMAFEAYHTANKRVLGQEVDEFSSLIQFKGGSLLVPIVLIGTGVVFLLHNFNVLRIPDMARFWPLIPIGIGVFMLYQRLGAGEPPQDKFSGGVGQEQRHEHR
ncbi:MAG: DUF5668 domain-containing protein [Bryobacteraceae bacterium]